MQYKKTDESVETVKRERERATFNKISFICAAKNNIDKKEIGYKMETIKFVPILWPIFAHKANQNYISNINIENKEKYA